MSRFDYWDYYKPSVPRAAKGGIKAQSGHRGFAAKWWGKRWIEVLESFNIGARLGRGRSYARRGQVLDIHIQHGLITAQVQGSRPKPYKVEIHVKTLTPAQWEQLVTELAGQVIYSARLLNGEMPEDIEKVFHQAGLSLFPQKYKDLQTECSCPDWSNPCKHIAAVYYLMGEEFDRDPFLMLHLRGINRAQLLEKLHRIDRKEPDPHSAAQGDSSSRELVPLPLEAEKFWHVETLELSAALNAVDIQAAVIKRLGHFPFWRSEQPFVKIMEELYRQAAVHALRIYVGEERQLKI